MPQEFHKFFLMLMLSLASAVVAGGCAKERLLAPDLGLISGPATPVYSDRDWAAVLRDHVRYGLVDYASLKADREPLERYCALISVTGPVTTPDQFPSSAHATAYYINAYNACVLRAVLEHFPVTTMYDIALPRLEHEYLFKIDAQVCDLATIEQLIIRSSDEDVRAFFATSRAAMGTPRLTNEPIQASLIERQFADAAAEALDNPDLCRIDRSREVIYVWQLVLHREDMFVQYWKTRRRVQSGYLFNVLLELASPQRRRSLQSAVGYTIKPIPFDRTLNVVTSRAGSNVVP